MSARVFLGEKEGQERTEGRVEQVKGGEGSL
jgi:hypothetical protein